MSSDQNANASGFSSGSGSGSSNIKTWLKTLLHNKSERENADSPATASASLSPPANSDMISFHHTMDEENERPSFLPPLRSFSGGSGATSFASAARRTLAQPIATPTTGHSQSTDALQRTISNRSGVSSSPGSSPSKSPGASKMLSQGISSLSNLIQHERRASTTYRQMRSGSANSSTQEAPSSNEIHHRPKVSDEVLAKDCSTGVSPENLKAGSISDRNIKVEARQSLASQLSHSLGSSEPEASNLLLPEGEPMLKVTHKKVKTRTFTLDADRGQILWESKRNTIVNLESIREVRFGPSAASYRTSLNISSAHEPRWITIIYQNVGIYKALHLIALSDASVARWRSSLLHLQTLRRELTGAVGASSSLEHRRVLWMRHHWKDADQSNDEKLSVEEVMKLCRRLGIESNKAHLRKCFNAADYRNRGYLDFEDFQYFVSLLKRRADVQLIFDAWTEQSVSDTAKTAVPPTKDSAVGITPDNFMRFVRAEQGNTDFADDQIHDLFIRHCNSRLSQPGTDENKLLMDYDGFLDFLSSSDNPPLTDQLPLFSTITADSDEGVIAERAKGSSSNEVKDGVSLLPGQLSQSLSMAQQKTPSRAFADTPEELIKAGPSSSHATTRKVAAHLRKSTVQHDMKRPLSEYYISSSHNTYLVGGQWKGDSTVEGYIRALLQGARSVELDCWNGPNLTPQITHGHTLTSRVAFQDVIGAIARYAFVSSPYPLILSLEVHADPQQQDVMARILIDTLGEMLLMQPPGSTKLAPSRDDDLPSPEDLRFKVLVKAKNILVSEKGVTVPEEAAEGSALPKNEVVQAFMDSASTSATETSTTDSEMDTLPTSGAKALVRRVTGRNKTSKSEHSRSNRKHSEVSSKDTKKLMSTALASLLIYTVGVKCRGFNKKESYATQHMISLSEKSAMKFIHDLAARESLIKHNRTHLTRVYPSMMSFARLHASRNFVPLDMWAAGCQLVALNWQTADLGFELNQAMFSRNGRCGFVLKPVGLRTKEQMKNSNTEKALRFCLDLRVISAQQLPKKKSDSSKDKDSEAREPIDPFVAVSLIAPESWGRQPRGLLRHLEPVCQEPETLQSDTRSLDSNLSRIGSSEAAITDRCIPSYDSGASKVTADPSTLSAPDQDQAVSKPNDRLHTDSGESRVECSQLRTPTIKGNGFSPQWNTAMSIQVDVPAGVNVDSDAAADGKASKADLDRLSRGLLDLCFVRFEVYDDDLESGSEIGTQATTASVTPTSSHAADTKAASTVEASHMSAGLSKVSSLGGEGASQSHSNSSAASPSLKNASSSASSTSSIEADCVAAFAVSIGALQQGYRHLPLYDHQLSQYLFSTLFIHSRLRFVGVVDQTPKQ